MTTVPFDRLRHMIRVPVTVGGDPYLFLVDTGIGVTVVSPAVAARADVRHTGETFTGRRMSGQEIRSPLVGLPEVRFGAYAVAGHPACVADLGDFDGIIGPAFFGGYAVTTDPDARTLTVHESARTPPGHPVPLDVRRDGPSVTAFAGLVLPSGRRISVEVDTGSPALILDSRFMADCGLDPSSAPASCGVDETGYAWSRHTATIAGTVHLTAAPETAQPAPTVLFQSIIHDGLIGTAYLDRYRTTVDIEAARLTLSPRRP